MTRNNPFPSLAEIDDAVDLFAARNSDIAHVKSLGLSAECREIRAVFVTDHSVPTEEKEVALVVCGRHGQELGTRMIGPALLNWLASTEGESTRKNQLVIVVPVANPDGCVRDEFWAPDDGLSETEERTILALAEAHQPDATLDIHSWGEPLDGEAIVTACTSQPGEDVFIYESIAARMADNAARSGYPFLVHREPRLGGYNNFYCGPCYNNDHSLVFGMEVNHNPLTPEEAAESGLAVVKTLLAEGNKRSPWQYHAGYPNRIIEGDFFTSIRATGATSTSRRRSRSEVWRNRRLFTVPERTFLAPNTVRVRTKYSGQALSSHFALVCRLRGFPALEKVHLNGEDVHPTTYRDSCSTYVSVDALPRENSEYELVIET